MSSDGRERVTSSPLIATTSEDRRARRRLRRLQRGVYTDPLVDVTPALAIAAAVQRAGKDAAVCGYSAAYLHGCRWVPTDRVELLRRSTGQSRRSGGVSIVRSEHLADADFYRVDGLLATSPLRTAYDIGRRSPRHHTIAYLDELSRVTEFDRRALQVYIDGRHGDRGIVQIRELLPHIDPRSESPGESALRLTLARDDLPDLDSQILIRDRRGYTIARFDLGYRSYRIAVEYDGEDFHTSNEQRQSDIHRDAATASLGWMTIRVTKWQLRDEPWVLIAAVHRALESRGWRQ